MAEVALQFQRCWGTKHKLRRATMHKELETAQHTNLPNGLPKFLFGSGAYKCSFNIAEARENNYSPVVAFLFLPCLSLHCLRSYLAQVCRFICKHQWLKQVLNVRLVVINKYDLSNCLVRCAEGVGCTRGKQVN